MFRIRELTMTGLDTFRDTTGPLPVMSPDKNHSFMIGAVFIFITFFELDLVYGTGLHITINRAHPM